MFGLFKKKQKSKNEQLEAAEYAKRSIAVFSPFGIDVSPLSKDLAAQKSNSIIVEFPCIGVPRLSNQFPDSSVDASKSIDQLLIDYDRNEMNSYEHYMETISGQKLIITNPNSTPLLPVLLRLQRPRTMIEVPLLLKRSLVQYHDLVVFSLQGQLINPMTLYTLKCVDQIVIMMEQLVELSWVYTTVQKLKELNIPSEKVIVFSKLDNIELPLKITGDVADILKQPITVVEEEEENETLADEQYTAHRSHINPIEHIKIKSSPKIDQSELSIADNETWNELLKRTRIFLRDRHKDEFVQAIYDEVSRQKVCNYIEDFIKGQTEFTFEKSLDEIIMMMKKEITEMGVLQEALDNPRITSIEVNSITETICEEDGIPVHKENIKFQDLDHLYSVISKMLMPMGKTLSANDPVIDSNYRGFRICVTLDKSRGGVTAGTPTISIRKFPPDVYSDDACVKYGNASDQIIEFFQDIYPCEPNTLICGGTNSGKTSQLIRIPLYLDPMTRILTIEDSEEMMLKQKIAYKDYRNIVAHIVKEHENDKKKFDIGRLVKTSLRENPTWIMIGEIRDSYAATQCQEAGNTGHAVATSVHASSAKLGAQRMMQLSGNDQIAASQVASTWDLIIHQADDHGTRRIMEICELLSFDGKEPKMNTIFKYDPVKGEHVFVNKLQTMRTKLINKRAPKKIIDKWCEA